MSSFDDQILLSIKCGNDMHKSGVVGGKILGLMDIEIAIRESDCKTVLDVLGVISELRVGLMVEQSKINKSILKV